MARIDLLIAMLVIIMVVACTHGDATGIGGGGGGGSGAGAGAGAAGGSGPCPSGLRLVQQIVTTETSCDLSGLPTQCAPICETDCADGAFAQGSMGSGCARAEDGASYCRCVCAECRR